MSKNRIEICGDHAKVYFYKTDGYFICDLEDVPMAKKTSWFLDGDGYACGWTLNRVSRFHRVVNKTPDGMLTDHINRDRLDNRKENLRTVTHLMNCNNNKNQDALPAKGVRTKRTKDGRIRYIVDVHDNDHKCIRVGTFDTLSEAIEARNKGYMTIKGVPFPFI